MRRVVINSTPLIILGNLNLLNVLHRLYGEVSVPQAVIREITAKNDSACAKVQNCPWLKVESVKKLENRRMFQAKLHDGEVEVMMLAMENPRADLVIIDDNAAKKTAKFLGLTVTGTLGVLLKAKSNGIIGEVKPIMDEMNRLSFYVSEGVRNMVLTQAGELDK